MKQILILRYKFTLRSTSKESATAFLLTVIGLCIAIKQPLNEGGEFIVLFYPYQEMIVIGHQTVCDKCETIVR